MKLLAFTMLTRLNASSRIHCYQFDNYFSANQIAVTYRPPSSIWFFQLCNEGMLGSPRLLTALLRRFYWHIWVPLKRLLALLLVPFYDLIFVERGLLQHCSRPWLENLLFLQAKMWRKKVVYFIDDAIYLDCPEYVNSVLSQADVIITVNKFLARYVADHNPNVLIFEMAVDLDHYPLREQADTKKGGKLVIGWVGNSNVGFRYLEQLHEPMRELTEKYPFIIFRVVSGRDFCFEGDDILVDNVEWRLDYEASVTFDIGLAPLLETEYDQLKSSFKILQYWAHGVPVVCSPTANETLNDGVNCLMAIDPGDWVEKISLLIDDPSLRIELARQGRKLVEERFNLELKGPQFASMLKSIASGSTDLEYHREDPITR